MKSLFPLINSDDATISAISVHKLLPFLVKKAIIQCWSRWEGWMADRRNLRLIAFSKFFIYFMFAHCLNPPA